MQKILSQLRSSYRCWIIALLAVFGILQANRVLSQTVSDYHQRADLLLENYLTKYWDGNYIRNTGEWTYIHGMDAVIDGAERTNKQKYHGLIETFYEAQDRRHGWLNDYYDDENWFVLTLIHAYDVTAEEKYLRKAEEIYKDILENAWDDSCCGETNGGLWWNKAKTQKATAANAGAVISGLQLYKRTNREEYRAFAKKVYDFWWTNMVDKTTYQVADHINTDGTKVWWKFTYNEGLMIGASMEMYNTFDKTSYLSYARNIAEFMVNNETVETAYGPVLSDGNSNQCSGDCWQFKAPGYKYLMKLYLQDKQKNLYQRVLKGSVDALWNLARNTENSVSVDWSGPVSSWLYNDQTQNAAAMAMSLFAKQNGPYPEPEAPEGQYEAENATIKGILLESNQPGYTGWGFVGGWNNHEQYIKFTVNNSTAGNKTVTLRYAAAAGDASRIILVNGAPATILNFPGTGGWNQFSTTSFTYNFPAGTSTIQVNHNANWLNLDHLMLSPVPFALLTADPTANLQVYPNPVQSGDKLNVTLQAEQPAEVDLQIVDIFGQKRLESKKQVQAGSNMLQMPLNGLSRGAYVLYIKQGNHIETKRIIVD
ncbi:glycoside hydrolase family 76 protein [Cesiribacter sp. SM1]|uniref:glycoside hydrolase family 76 protein n=1 Tax=Cesiribacter sp. SM1 TaxID=2861196 RepID=UPI001CD636C1|nr:glycoside hydrolase family 76 protein [Cesiribacter sp. SM1]